MPAAPCLRFTARRACVQFSSVTAASISFSYIALRPKVRGRPASSRRSGLAAAAPPLPPALVGLVTVVVAPAIRISLLAPPSSSFSSSVPWSFGPSLQLHYQPSSLLRPLLTSPPLSPRRSPQVRRRICPLVPPGSTACVLMILGLRCSAPACRPHPASLPVRVPTVEDLLRASFGFTSRLRLAFRYGCRHRLRLAPLIQLDSAHAGHTPERSGGPALQTSVRTV